MSILFNEPSPIPLHAIAAMIAIVLGAFQLYMKKGTKLHKLMGWVWVSLILVISFSSFFIHELKMWGKYSAIHILSVITILGIIRAIYYIRVGNVKAHKRIMIILYFFSLILAGIFTLYPGRVMHQVIF